MRAKPAEAPQSRAKSGSSKEKDPKRQASFLDTAVLALGN